MKRVATIIKMTVCVLLCLSLCGCSLFEFNLSQKLVSPAATGDEGAIQSALETFISGEFGAAAVDQYKLKYPNSGDYRTAFVLEDMDNDGVSEALAFYALSEDKPLAHINYLRKQGKSWTSVADVESESSDIREVRFSDLNGDGHMELLVGYEMSMVRDSRLCLYRMTQLGMNEMASYWYSDLFIGRVSDEKRNDVVVFHISNADYEVEARLVTMEDGKMKTCGKTSVDGYIEKFQKFKSVTFDNGSTGLYVDCEKEGDVVITELLLWNGKTLSAPFYDSFANMTTATARTSELAFGDVDADGQIEWPVCEELPLPQSDVGETLWLTRWCSYDAASAETVTKFYSVSVPQDGYLFRLDDEWLGHISATYNKASRCMELYYTEGEKETMECVIRNGSVENTATEETAADTGKQLTPLVYKTVTLKGSGTNYFVWWNEKETTSFHLDMNEILYRMTVLS